MASTPFGTPKQGKGGAGIKPVAGKKDLASSAPDTTVTAVANKLGAAALSEPNSQTTINGYSIRRPQLKIWEQEIIQSNAEVKRKATITQLYFLDYYFSMLSYLAARKERRSLFDQDTEARSLTPPQLEKELKNYLGRERVLLRKRRAKLKVDQFHIIAQVGQGGYGEVYLARKQDSGEVCALKKMKKGALIKMDEARHVLVERDILTATKSPWLVRLLYAFQDPEHVCVYYLAMEYVPGGDFRTLLNNSGVLKEEHARFYISEMFMAVTELHRLGYIHRDLKPENFLVDGQGHVKLTDFGLATGSLDPQRIASLRHKLEQVKNNEPVIRSTLERRSQFASLRKQNARWADSVVGSPDYMAPEVLRGKVYTYSVDYWSLGCILFEFLAGFPPFSGATADETWANLKQWTTVLIRPVYDKPEDLVFNLADHSWDLITRLIAHASVRYNTLEKVTSHPFFTNSKTDFSRLRERTPPFVPSLDSEVDTGYYDDFTSLEDMAKYAEVQAKKDNVDKMRAKEGVSEGKRGVWVGFTFGKTAVAQATRDALKANDEAIDDNDAPEGLFTIF
ncbi:hypothetical protein FRC17_007444 [Serendipita sp. 399]|nr:hypothetical protein FRC17_007444 [Serendipita sp. 399]